MHDLKSAFRKLLSPPGSTAVAVLTLALGIGANTAIFSVVNAVLLRPLPHPEPGQLVQLRADRPGSPSTFIGSATFVEVKAQSQSLARIAAYSGGDMTLTGAGPAERIVSGAVTADFFPLLGVQPAVGRNFTREEDTPNGPKAAILGHGLWQSRFGGDPDVLGRTITLNQQSYTVVGILPARFQYPERFQLWTPLALGDRKSTRLNSSHGYISYAVFCLKKKKKNMTYHPIFSTTQIRVTTTNLTTHSDHVYMCTHSQPQATYVQSVYGHHSYILVQPASD